MNNLSAIATVRYVPKGDKGDKGDTGEAGISPTVYELKPAHRSVVIAEDGTRTPASTSCSVVRRYANTYQIMADYEVEDAGLEVRAVVNGEARENITSLSLADVTQLRWILKLGSEVVDQEEIAFVRDGETGADGAAGQRGEKGPAIRVRKWEDCYLSLDFMGHTRYTLDFMSGDDGQDFLDICLLGEVFYQCIKTPTVLTTTNITPFTPGSDSGTYWQAATGAKFIATDLFLANKAKIGNLFVDCVEIPKAESSAEYAVRMDASGCHFTGTVKAQTLTLGSQMVQNGSVLCDALNVVDLSVNTNYNNTTDYECALTLPILLAGESRVIEVLAVASGDININAKLTFCGCQSTDGTYTSYPVTDCKLVAQDYVQFGATMISSALGLYRCIGWASGTTTWWQIVRTNFGEEAARDCVGGNVNSSGNSGDHVEIVDPFDEGTYSGGNTLLTPSTELN